MPCGTRKRAASTAVGRRRNARVWVRLGDGDEYHSFDGPFEAGEHVGQFTRDRHPVFQSKGVTLGGFEGQNYISLYWGNQRSEPLARADLSPQERQEFLRGLNEAPLEKHQERY
jgi:hypothetical protein